MKVYLLFIEDPWDEYYEHKYQGVFKTREEAEAAYKNYRTNEKYWSTQLEYHIKEEELN